MSTQSPESPVRINRRVTIGGLGAATITLGSGLVRGSSATATPAAAGQMTPINGVDIYYEVHGPADGQPVLLLHGGIGNTEEFAGLLPDLLAAGYRTIAFDARGRGRSTWDDIPITYEVMAADAVSLLDHLGVERTDLVGWSDGAIVALYLAIEYPERLDRVVAYGANFTPDGVYSEPRPSDQLPPFEQFVADYQRLSPAPERFDELMEQLGALYTVAPNLGEGELKRITAPVLILAGAEEEMVKPDQPVRLAELIPGAELILIPGTGHFAPFAKPKEFNQAVLDFLRK